MASAARIGLKEAVRFPAMTPREISLLLSAHYAVLAQRRLDRWALAKLTALSLHAPDRLPPPPEMPLEDMTDDEMKRRLLAWRGKD